MKLILVRHGEAGEQDPARWPIDSDRPLTERGAQRFKNAAARLGRLTTPDALVSSPYLRAVQTARLLESEAGWPPAVLDEEVAKGNVAEIVSAHVEKNTGTLAVVGHEPTLSRFASQTISRGGTSVVRIEPGTAVLIDLDSADTGELTMLAPQSIFQE